jgi:hypothetical protein
LCSQPDIILCLRCCFVLVIVFEEKFRITPAPELRFGLTVGARHLHGPLSFSVLGKAW